MTEELFNYASMKFIKTMAWNLSRDSGICGPILTTPDPTTSNISILTLNGRVFIILKFLRTQEDLFVEDPRPGPNIILYLEELKEYLEPFGAWSFIQPIEGQMIMFPAWLPHGVEINESKEKGEKGMARIGFFQFYSGE